MTITPKISNFIETHYDLIEQSKWYDFFDEMHYSALTAEEAKTCLRILQSVGVEINEEERHRYMINIIREWVEYNKDMEGAVSIITVEYLLDTYSCCGFTATELSDIIEQNIDEDELVEVHIDKKDPESTCIKILATGDEYDD